MSDQLFATGDDSFIVDGSGSSQLTITATGSRELFTLHEDFVDFMKTVRFATDDQEGSSEHSVSIVVQEYPLETSPPSLPAFVRVVVEPVNDRPVILSTQRSQHELTGYLPESANEGFSPSFLINETNVEDIDRVFPPFVGLAVTGFTDNGRGMWMVWENTTWVPLSAVTDCTPQLVPPDGRVRFVPSADPSKTASQASIVYRAWDGTSLIECVGETPVFSSQSAVSAENETFTFNVEYLNRAPTIVQGELILPSTDEDTSSEPLLVGDIAGGVASDSDDLELGLAVFHAYSRNGVWQYQSMGMWNPFPAWLSPQSVLLLSSDIFIRFIPETDFFGLASFSAFAWDMTDNSTNVALSDPYTGTFSIDNATISISIDSVNDPPVVVVGVPMVEYTEGGPSVQIFRNLSISDVDSEELAWAEVVLECTMCLQYEGSGEIGSGASFIANSTDTLLTRHAPPNFIPTVEYSDPTQIILRVESVGRSLSEFVRYLETLHFASSSREPSSAPRTASLTVNDGTNTSNTVSVNISILLINDEPPTVILPYESITWIEDSGDLRLFYLPVLITDPDYKVSLLELATVELLDHDPTYENLSVNCSQFGLNCIYEEGVLTLFGLQPTEVYQQALQQVFYVNTNPEPTGDGREVYVSVFDGVFFEGSTLSIDVELINDQIPVVMVEQDEVIFREPESNPITTSVRVAPSLTISDTDSGSFPLHSATLTILDPRDGVSEGLRLPTGETPSINLTGQSQHSLTISHEEGIPLIVLQDVVRQIEYFNSAEQLEDTNRTIEIVVRDSLTYVGVQPSLPVEVRVVFVRVDDLPEVRLADNILMYSEDQTPLQLPVAVGADIIDVDSTQLSGLEIELTANGTIDLSGERLEINLTGFEGIISRLPSGSPMLIALVGRADLYDYTSVLRTLTYQNEGTSGDPDSGVRTITATPFSVAGEQGTSDSVRVVFTAVNNAPVVDLNGPLAGLNNVVFFVEGNTEPVRLTPEGVTITDVDSEYLAFVRVELLNMPDGLMESISVQNTSLYVVQDSSVIEVVGHPSPISEFVAVLSTLAYQNLADEPDPVTRTVSVEVSDGQSSGYAQVEIAITLLNDAPVVALSVSEVLYVEGGSVNIASGAEVLDPDSFIVGYRVRPQQLFPGDLISGPYLSFVQNSSAYIATFSPILPQAAADLLGDIEFTSTDPEPTAINRVFCISVEDEQTTSSPEVCVTVEVQVVNDNIPQFRQAAYEAEVDENEPNTFVSDVSAVDADSANSVVQLEYSITAGDDCSDTSSVGSGSGESGPLLPEPRQVCRFEIDPLTGAITTTSTAPDREERDRYTLTISVSDGELSNETELVVAVADVNDVAPVFVPEVYQVAIPVGAEEGYIFAELMVIDPDSDSEFTLILLSMDPSTGTNVFAVDESVPGGVILNRQERDLSPSVDQYILRYEAVDSRFPFQMSTNIATVIVNITQNQEPPVFDMESYEAMVPENVAIGASILTVTATDSDPGYHGEFTFSIPTSETPFIIDPETGVVSVSDSADIDFETVQEYVFTVVATDTGRPQMSSSATVRVGVININDNPPSLAEEMYTAEVCESAPVGYQFLHLLAQDEDGDTLTYTVVDMFGCSNCVAINSSTGALYLAQEVDYEDVKTISFSVIVSDGLFFSDVVVTLAILNDNEAAPEFSFESVVVEIPETEGIGSFIPLPEVFVPLALDEDDCTVDQCDGASIISNITCTGGTSALYYAISSGNEEGLFEIDPLLGLVSVAGDLDADVGPHLVFNLTLSVSDGTFTDEAYLTIIVDDINDNLPQFENNSYSASVREDTPVGTIIITTLASDLDPTDNLHYSLIDENGHFNITQNGEVFVVEPLDFETISQYSLIVTVTDRPFASNATVVPAPLTVYITNVNDNPPMFLIPDPIFYIQENTAPGLVGRVQAVDIDSANATLFYSIVSEIEGFVIDSGSGEIQSTLQFDRESQDYYEIIVQAADNGIPPLSSNITVRIVIQDINEDPPSFSNSTPSSVSVPESADVGTIILTLTASDGDQNTVGFRVVGEASGMFSLEPADSGVEGSGVDVETEVTEQSVHLVLTGTLDYEAAEVHSVVVEAFDMPHTMEGMSLSSTVAISVVVVDENDNPPRFLQAVYTAEVSELAATGTFVTQVQATDPDSGSNADIRYSIESSNGLFAIDPETGIVTVASSESILIELIGAQYELVVVAHNTEPPYQESYATIVVELQDINNNAPFFPNANITFFITEDFTPTGLDGVSSDVMMTSSISGSGMVEASYRFISTVVAVDLDQGSNAELRFSLLTETDLFFIDPLSGDLYVSGTLDREQQDTYTIEVHVTDTGRPPMVNTTSVLVIVTDINDNAPVFLEESYSGLVAENEPAFTNIVRLSAIDADIGQNAAIIFSVIDGGSLPFTVDQESGYVMTTAPLDGETQAFYSFQVEASSGHLASVVNVSITVEDKNEFPPTIFPNPLNTSVTENTPIGSLVQTFSINDDDFGGGAETNVFLTSSTSLFLVVNNSLLVAGHIDHETTQSVSLSVVARNLAPPHFESVSEVFVTIENENDNPPIVGFGTTSVRYGELIEQHVTLDISITITDADGREATRLVDGIVEFENEFVEPSFAYEPTTNGELEPEFSCDLEIKKRSKFSPCGIPDVTVLSRYTEGILQLQGGLTVGVNVVGDSIIFDSSFNQYALYIENVGTLDSSGLTISMWMWYEPTASAEPQTILSKISSSQLLYGIFCHSDGSLVFNFTSSGSAEATVFSGGCSALEGAWHHLAVVVDNTNPLQWALNLFIDGAEFGSVDIPQPFDSTGGFLLGASRDHLTSPTTNFFNGRMHLLVVSLSSSSLNSLNCVSGCGLVLVSTQDTTLTYYYDYSQRALIVQGTEPIGIYEEFLNSLVLVLPFSEPRISQYMLSYTVQDEIFNCLPTFIDIIVIPSNDFQPELSLNGTTSGDYSTAFVEEMGPVGLVNPATFYLRDMDLIEFEYVVTAQILDALQPSSVEVLSVQNVPEGMNVSYTTDHTLTLTGLFALPVFEAVTRTLTYDNTADEPVGASREVLISVSDPPLADVSARSLVQFVFVNDQPELLLISTVSQYREGDGAVIILDSVDIEDSDSPILYSAVVSLTPLNPGMEYLSTDTTGTNITAAYDLPSATLTLTGADTHERYDQVLLSTRYEHTGMASPTLGTRRISFVISDGEAESVAQVVSLFFAEVNDAPVINLSGGSDFNFRVTLVEDSSDSVSVVSLNATIMDVDGDTLSYLNITLLDSQPGESLSVFVPNTETITAFHIHVDIVTLVPTTGSSAPLADFETVLRTVRYIVPEEPTPGTHTIQFLASDGEDVSLPAFAEVNVISVNDRPILDLDTESPGTGYVTEDFVERGVPVNITGRSVSLTDNDIDDEIESVLIIIQGAGDGLDERITSTDPSVVLPLPANGDSVTYMISRESFNTTDPITFLTSLQYSNTRLEPTPGQRTITVAVSDGTDFSNTALVLLTVIGINENTPEFSMNTYSFAVYEGLAAPELVGSVTATDIDDGVDGAVTYEILDSTPSDGLSHFTINSTSGLISTALELDREHIELYELTVLARDGGLPQQTANATLYITVLDINDNAPIFYPDGDNVEIVVSETTAVGEVVETIPLIDPDSGADIISLQLTSTGVPFEVGIFNHQITVGEDLDVDSEGCTNDGRRFELVLVATDSYPPHPSSTATLSILVMDVNDNAPQFVSNTSFTVFEENVNLDLFAITAIDLDCSSNAEITYSFQDSSTYSFFNISSSTGLVSSLGPLDREDREMYSFTVVATDGGNPRQSASTDITLQVLDINDNAPIFGEDLYEFEVREDDGIVTLAGIEATDLDSGENGQVPTYYLDPATVPVNPLTDKPLFAMDPTTGVIIFNTTALPVEFEFEARYNLTVSAVDSGSPSLTGIAAVAVRVADVNDNSPVVVADSPRGEVPENMAGYLIATFSATDADSGQNGEVTFSLQDSYDASFSIDPTTGDLTAVQPLDFEEQCYYTLYVVATDKGPTPLSSTPYLFEVFVQPVEDVPPQFVGSPYSASVPENSPTGTLVATVTAEDGDLSECMLDIVSGSGVDSRAEGLSYSFIESSDSFAIDELTGEVHLLVPLDYEERQQYVLTVVATDVGNLRAEGTVVVNVLDRNDVAPQFLQPFYEAAIPENTAVGSSVLQVSARDEDTLDQGRLVFSITDSSPYFDIDRSSGAVFVSDTIDFETVGESVSLLAVVTDSAGNTATVPVIISIVDTNDLPPVITTTPQTLVFTEGQLSLQPFTTLDISDPDSFQHLCNATVVLYAPEQETLDPPDYCSCSDSTSPSSCTPGCLEFLQLPPESFPGLVQQLEGGLELVLMGNHSIEEFEMALARVEYVNFIFDPEPQPRSVSLSVSDCQLSSNTLVQSIDIQPLNLVAPTLDLNGGAPGINYQTSFTERGDAVAIVSENVSISDEDMIRVEQVLTSLDITLTNPLDEHEFIYTTTIPVGLAVHSNSTHFTVSGEASLEEYASILRSFYYSNPTPEPSPQPRIVEFVAHEFSLSSPPAYTEIRIDTINDYPPSVIANPPRVNYVTSFVEGSSGVGIVASTATIEDNDSTNDNVTEMEVYILNASPTESLILTTPPPAEITLEQVTHYRLTFSGSASRAAYEAVLRAIHYQNTVDEFESLFPPAVVFIQIADHSLSGFTAIQVHMTPVNDHTPQFAEDRIAISVSENATVGASLYQLEYTDQDSFSPTEPSFNIAGGSSFFSISPDAGVITLAQSLDHEIAQQHNITVELRDLGFVGSPTPTPASVEVTVLVTDQNDHAPMFTRELYNATVNEGAPIGTSVLQVSASDRDSQMHSLLEFDVINTTAFSVDSTGVIFTLAELDQEVEPFYQFVVSVRNPGDVVADTADVFITILDINDHAPVITLSPATAILQEAHTRTSLSSSLTISDSDSNPSLDYAVVEILGVAPGALIATSLLPEISVTGNGSASLAFIGPSQSLSDYEQVLRGVVYEDASEEPLQLTREIGYQVGSDPGLIVALNYTESETRSNVAVFQVSVELINDQKPEILLDTRGVADSVLPGCSMTGSYSTNYTEDSRPVPLSDPSLTIQDSDSGETLIAWASVELLEPAVEDSLNYSGALEINSTISTPFHLVIQGPATIAEFEAALRTVSYHTTSQSPRGTRQIEFTVNDGVFTSEPVLACVELFGVNDAPMVTLGADGSVDTIVMYSEGQTEGLLLASQLTITGKCSQP